MSHTDIPPLEKLSQGLLLWRKERKIKKEPVPKPLRALTAEVMQTHELKLIRKKTGLTTKRLHSIREEFSPNLISDKTKGSSKSKDPLPPMIHLSEIKFNRPSSNSSSVVSHQQHSTVIVSIDDNFGRNLKVYSHALNPTSIIDAFLNTNELENK